MQKLASSPKNYQTLGSCAEPTEETPVVWRYRYNAGAERELKWLQSADLLPDIAKNWVYYQLGADKRQHGVYNGRETFAPDLCSNMDNRVHWFPTEYLTYGLGGTPLISYKPYVEDGETYYIADHLGNTRVTLSTNGNVVSAKDFEPFGKELHSNGNDRLTFIGKEKDAESDLGDFGVRKYEAEYGRFLQAEPQWERYISLSTYQYGCNNPLLLFDITGFGVEDVNRFLQNANQHLNSISNKRNEFSGFLVGKSNESWVRWAGLHEGTPSHAFTPASIGELDGKYDSEQPKYEWGEGVLGRAHSHPGGGAFSPSDIATFAFSTEMDESSEKTSGNFSVIEAGDKRYVLEIQDRTTVKDWYSKIGGITGIEKIWWDTINNTKGTESEKILAAVAAVVNTTGGSLKFYQTTDDSKTKAQEVKK